MLRLPSLLALTLLLALVGCDSSGGDPTIGGTYSGLGTNGQFVLTIPANTESAADATFNISGVDVSTSFSGTATYDYPTLDVTIQIAGQSPQFSCTVADGGDSMTCPLATGNVTITR